MTRLSQLKNQCYEYHKLNVFWLRELIAQDWKVIECYKERKNFGPSLLINWSGFDTSSQILWPLSLAQSTLKDKKNCDIHDIAFLIVRVRVIWQMFNLQLIIEPSGFWHNPRHCTISQSRAIFSQRRKRVNLTQAWTNAYFLFVLSLAYRVEELTWNTFKFRVRFRVRWPNLGHPIGLKTLNKSHPVVNSSLKPGIYQVFLLSCLCV